MKKCVLAAIVLMMTGSAGAVHYLPPVKYGQEFTLYFSLYDSNSPWQFYETAPAAADDVHLRKDGGAAANPTNSVTKIGDGHTMSLVLTATEMQVSQLTVDMNDADSPALYGSDTWVIATFGHTSALQAFDLDDADPSVDATKINGVATTSVSTVSAYLGTAQPINQTGTGTSAVVKGDGKALLENSTYGLSAIKTLIDTIDTVVDSVYAALGWVKQ